MKRANSAGSASRPLFAALDLGSNNCRLLIASPRRNGFRVLDSFSRIVRLGEGVARTGRLSDASMERTIAALKICAEKISARRVQSARCIATQACRSAQNGEAFLDRVKTETGLSLEIVAPEVEASLAVHGSRDLVDLNTRAALIFDIGGGSTELSWVRVRRAQNKRPHVETVAWTSVPVGVVTVAEDMPTTEMTNEEFSAVADNIVAQLATVEVPEDVRAAFSAGRAHLIGTSGTVTSLAGVHLNLPRYDRAKVDGLWMQAASVETVTERLRALGNDGRSREPCIGAQRADLVVPGCAILSGILKALPVERIRVGDRGLREGLLIEQIAAWRNTRSSDKRASSAP
ncbi:MAG: Ppx/GppA phosphatase family protein [Parvularcula sp.]